MKMSGANFESLMADLAAALEDLRESFGSDPALWSRQNRGGWTPGQHVDHVAAGLTATADSLEQNEHRLRQGSLHTAPGRGPLQLLWVMLAIGGGKFPRGGKSPRAFWPTATPETNEVFERLRLDSERHRALGQRLTPAQRDRLWIRNPFLRRWHYSFPEVLRMHAVHARHHARQIREIVQQAARPPGG